MARPRRLRGTGGGRGDDTLNIDLYSEVLLTFLQVLSRFSGVKFHCKLRVCNSDWLSNQSVNTGKQNDIQTNKQTNKQIIRQTRQIDGQTKPFFFLTHKICLRCREKEALMGYLKSVDRALEQSKDQVRLSKGALGPYEHSLPQLILPDERLAMDGLSLSPELLSCQVSNID